MTHGLLTKDYKQPKYTLVGDQFHEFGDIVRASKTIKQNKQAQKEFQTFKELNTNTIKYIYTESHIIDIIFS